MNKIYIYRLGGLGNQLFQIANGYSLSKEYNKDLFLNLDTNENQFLNTKRNHFNNTIFKNFKKEKIPENVSVYQEERFNFKNIYFKDNNKNILLNGYFQSEKYFNKYKLEIQHLFLNYLNEIEFLINPNCFQNNTISLHVRRTDYTNLQDIHPCCSMNYYKHALELLNYHDKQVLIFSDDLNFCKSNDFFLIKNKIYMETKTNNDEINTLIYKSISTGSVNVR